MSRLSVYRWQAHASALGLALAASIVVSAVLLVGPAAAGTGVSVKVGHDGTFSTKFYVRAGIVGDGYCGTNGETTCVIAISTAKGQGTVVKIGFATAESTTSSTTVP